jgi:hypothetical protein
MATFPLGSTREYPLSFVHKRQREASKTAGADGLDAFALGSGSLWQGRLGLQMPLADATLQTIARGLAGLELEPNVLLKIGAAIPSGGKRRPDAGGLLQPDAGSRRLAAGESGMTRRPTREVPFRQPKPRRDVVIATVWA